MKLLALSAVRKFSYGIFFKDKKNYDNVDYRLQPWKEAGDLACQLPFPVIWRPVFAVPQDSPLHAAIYRTNHGNCEAL